MTSGCCSTAHTYQCVQAREGIPEPQLIVGAEADQKESVGGELYAVDVAVVGCHHCTEEGGEGEVQGKSHDRNQSLPQLLSFGGKTRVKAWD